MSNTPLREALTRLEAEGPVTRRNLREYWTAGLLDQRRARNLHAVRLLLEPSTAEVAAQGEDTQPLTAAREETLIEADARFHNAIAVASGKSLLANILAGPNAHAHNYLLGFHGGMADATLNEHRAVQDPLTCRDPAAAATTMRNHPETSRDRLLPVAAPPQVTSGPMTEPAVTSQDRPWRIDAHRHYWDPARGDYTWMPLDGPLAQPHLPADRRAGDTEAGIAGSVVVQAAPAIAETHWLLRYANQEPAMYGVVGWIDLETTDADRQIDTIRHPRLVGVRPMIQDIPDDEWITRPAVMRNLATVARSGLRFDALVHTRHLPYLIEAIQPVPDLVVVIDHLAKPDYSSLDETWIRGLRNLARRENTFMKISGMATEVSGSPHAHRFRDHVEFVLETFGAARCMAGSDWPVSTLALEFARTCQLLDELTNSLSSAEQRQVWRETSVAAYGLNISS